MCLETPHSLSAQMDIKLWNLNNKEEIFTLTGHLEQLKG
jgi:hypothetical protein